MKNKKVKVSIIVPVYNTKLYLHQCLKSICSQTLKEIEIILVDDGSFDGSSEICDQYSLKDARIHVLHKKNGGLVSARQAGLAVVIGEYIGFVDSDDWIEADMYRELYEIAVGDKADMVAEGIIDEIEDACWRSYNRLPSGKYKTVKEKEKIYQSMLSCENFFCMGIQPYLCNKLIRRELAVLSINKIPPLIRVGEDAAAIYPMIAQADTIVLSDTAHYHYCHRSTSMMLGKRQEEQEYKNAVLLYSFLKKSFEEIGIYHVMREQLLRYRLNNLMTRAYGKFAGIDQETVLFPFSGISQNDSIILYGAGALGKAVYQYIVFSKCIKIKAWIDQKAEVYQKLEMNVSVLDNVEIDVVDKIIVAVFSEAAYWKIRENLIRKGAVSSQIKWMDTKKLWNMLRTE